MKIGFVLNRAARLLIAPVTIALGFCAWELINRISVYPVTILLCILAGNILGVGAASLWITLTENG